MKLFLFSLFFFKLSGTVLGQLVIGSKPPVDSTAIKNWVTLDSNLDTKISNDGEYISYSIYNKPYGSQTVVVQSTSNLANVELAGATAGFFSCDSKQYIFTSNDSLYFLPVNKKQPNFIDRVLTYNHPQADGGKWLAYQINNDEKPLILLNLLTGEKLRFDLVLEYSFEKHGKALMIKTIAKEDDLLITTFKLITLNDGTISTIWSDDGDQSKKTSLADFEFDNIGEQLVFRVEEKKNLAIWYYKAGMPKASLKACNNSPGVATNLMISGQPKFSTNGKWIFFELKEAEESRKVNPDWSKLNVWDYRDAIVQPEQEIRYNSQRKFQAVISVSGIRVVQLNNDNEQLSIYLEKVTGDYIIIVDNNGGKVPFWWQHESKPSYWLVSLFDGRRSLIGKKGKFGTFSPNGQYYIFWDEEQASYMCYNIVTRKVINITRSISEKISRNYIDWSDPTPVSTIAGWLANDTMLFLYDNYDVWEVDPTATKKPINITNGYGKRHHLKYRILQFDEGYSEELNTYQGNEVLFFTAFNDQNKYSGFYKKNLLERKDPTKLTLGPYKYYLVGSQLSVPAYENSMKPIKARNAEKWVVLRESSVEAPNYFLTTDFINYKKLSAVEPQKTYNWLTTKLISWKMKDGNASQGILYLPENFDAKKKYPIIFNFYEAFSFKQYEFPGLSYTYDNLSIALFVSNGYLVFQPDIHFGVAAKTGKVVGEYAFNSVVSAAQYLGRLPYIDFKRMAIQGHSFGGLEAAYLVTHTSIFAAACEAAGFTDPISNYLTLVPEISPAVESRDNQWYIEKGHQLYGASPWQRPELYRKNSPILAANNTTTPLLIMHNKMDNNVQWRQGIEFYMALRRLGKTCWMLQYENGLHAVSGIDAIDYTIRLMEFFDHYLKNSPAPKWMTQGLPARLKQVENRYEYDPIGNCSKGCKVCKEWNEKMKKDSVTTWKEIKEKTKTEHWMGGGE